MANLKKFTKVDDSKPTVTYKVVILGESGVGKTCILRRLIGNEYRANTRTTIGIDNEKVTFQIRGINVNLQIWDTAGQETFRSITRSYYRGAEGILLVFDSLNKKSFDKLYDWNEMIYETLIMGQMNNKHSAKIPLFLAANKIDMGSKHYKDNDIKKFIDENNIDGFYEVSAKNGHNVVNLFEKLAESILLSRDHQLIKDFVAPERFIEENLQKKCKCLCLCKHCSKCEHKYKSSDDNYHYHENGKVANSRLSKIKTIKIGKQNRGRKLCKIV